MMGISNSPRAAEGEGSFRGHTNEPTAVVWVLGRTGCEYPGQVRVSLAGFVHLDSNSRGRPAAGQRHNPFGNVRLRR
jgi:hypothetical protein